MLAPRQKQGFTIVELLIVIVVIAILATIAVVAYNGTQQRASISAGKPFDSSLRRSLSIEGIAALSFNEGSGSSSKDASGQGNNATITGTWVSGMDGGSAIQANNNGTGATLPGSIYFADKSFTVTAWVNASDNDGVQSRILGKDFFSPGPSGWFWINFGNGKPFIEAKDSTGIYWSTSPAATDISGKWAHVAAVVDRTKGLASFYINGKLEKQTSVVSSVGVFGDNTATQPFKIGYQSATASSSLDGIVDDVYIYGSSLSLARLEQLYEEGSPQLAKK